MQQVMQPRPRTTNPQRVSSRVRRQGFFETLVHGLAPLVLVLLFVSAILGGAILPAQINVLQAPKPAQQQSAAKPTPEAIVGGSSASPAPMWVGNQPPNPAKVSWDSRGLQIEASNSSLEQILRQVAAATGARLEGLTQDQRIFGSYGPGPGCDVLSKLLDGSGYNIFMIGCRDANAPLQIVLSVRPPASPHTNNQSRSNSEHDEADERLKPEPQPEPSSPPPNQDPFNVGGPPSDPQQHMQEILQRQQKIDQQQLQQNNPQQ